MITKLDFKINARVVNEFTGSPLELQLISPDGSTWIGRAIRTGITPPGYPERAVYQWQDKFYVYEDGELILASEWRENYRRQVATAEKE